MSAFVLRMMGVLVAMMTLTACEQSSEPLADAGEILPLEVGNSWTYARTYARFDSVFVDSVTMSVRTRDTVQGVEGYGVENLIIGPFTLESFFMLDSRPDGLHYISWGISFPPQVPYSRKALSFPTSVGDSTEFFGYTITTESLDRAVTVPAGTFDCIEYVVRLDTSVVGTIWSRPEVGFVRTWAKYGLVEYTHDLVAFSVR